MDYPCNLYKLRGIDDLRMLQSTTYYPGPGLSVQITWIIHESGLSLRSTDSTLFCESAYAHHDLSSDNPGLNPDNPEKSFYVICLQL